jgi:hypothetical protein
MSYDNRLSFAAREQKENKAAYFVSNEVKEDEPEESYAYSKCNWEHIHRSTS